MDRFVRLIWSGAFLVGGFNHARDIATAGWLPYDHAPIALNWFWTLLLPLDLAIVALLWTRTTIGIWAGVAVMVADVVINSWFMRSTGYDWLSVPVQLQTLFLGFVLGSTPFLLGRSGRRGRVTLFALERN